MNTVPSSQVNTTALQQPKPEQSNYSIDHARMKIFESDWQLKSGDWIRLLLPATNDPDQKANELYIYFGSGYFRPVLNEMADLSYFRKGFIYSQEI